MDDTCSREIARLTEQITQLKRHNKRLVRFIEIGRAISAQRDIDLLIPSIMKKISRSLDVDRTTLFLVDWDRMELWTKFAQDLEVDRVSIELKMGLVGLSILTKEAVNVVNAHEDPRFNMEIDEKTGFRTSSVLAVPLFDEHGEVSGAVELLNKKSGIFNKNDERLVVARAKELTYSNVRGDGFTREAEALVHSLKQVVDFDRGSVFLLEKDKAELVAVFAEGLNPGDIRLSMNLGIAGLVAITGKELNIEDVYSDPRFDRRVDEDTGYRTRCILCVPIRNHAGDVLGVMELINKHQGAFNQEDMTIVKTLSSIVAIAIENALLFHEQDHQFRSILEVLAASIDAKDTLTAGHSERVTRFAAGIARELGFGQGEIDVLSVAALLHDYGKLGIDDSILKKPGTLTETEFEYIKTHVVNTRNILDKMYFMRKYRNVPMIASCHHERLDGSGYMGGLKTHEIPFMSKIIAVADVFEALTAKRHYRNAMSDQEALSTLEEESGTKFDEIIVAALGKYIASRNEDDT